MPCITFSDTKDGLWRDDWLYANTDFELQVDSPRVIFQRPLREGAGNWSRVGDREQELLRQLLDIDGLKEVRVKPYTVEIVKASTVFDWSNMSGPIVAAFKIAFPEITLRSVESIS